MEGYIGSTATIKKISFPSSTKIEVVLMDGRSIVAPLSRFPSIKKLNETDRKRWSIIDNTLFTFRNCSEVYHIEQILGKEQDYAYQTASMVAAKKN